jgi:hypothetical protein
MQASRSTSTSRTKRPDSRIFIDALVVIVSSWEGVDCRTVGRAAAVVSPSLLLTVEEEDAPVFAVVGRPGGSCSALGTRPAPRMGGDGSNGGGTSKPTMEDNDEAVRVAAVVGWLALLSRRLFRKREGGGGGGGTSSSSSTRISFETGCLVLFVSFLLVVRRDGIASSP